MKYLLQSWNFILINLTNKFFEIKLKTPKLPSLDWMQLRLISTISRPSRSDYDWSPTSTKSLRNSRWESLQMSPNITEGVISQKLFIRFVIWMLPLKHLLICNFPDQIIVLITFPLRCTILSDKCESSIWWLDLVPWNICLCKCPELYELLISFLLKNVNLNSMHQTYQMRFRLQMHTCKLQFLLCSMTSDVLNLSKQHFFKQLESDTGQLSEFSQRYIIALLFC